MEILFAFLLVAVGLIGGWFAGRLHARAADNPAALESATERAVVKEGLDRLQDQLRDLEHQRVSWQAQLGEQVLDVRRAAESLRLETASLATALRKPQVRGRWGELHLRRAVELAGLVNRCDFTEQQTIRAADGILRPDLVVRLAGGKQVVVDAKVPLDAFLDATGAHEDRIRQDHLARHARQLRTHVDALADKAYWRSLPATPEFVVLFVPGDSFLGAALEADPTLLDDAAGKRVILATPSTLIALLRTVAYAWTQETVNEQAREIHQLGRELYERIGTMSAHLDRLGRSLTSTISAYNAAVGSLESRVLVSSRKLSELSPDDQTLESPRVVVDAPRALSAPELLEAATPARPEIVPNVRKGHADDEPGTQAG